MNNVRFHNFIEIDKVITWFSIVYCVLDDVGLCLCVGLVHCSRLVGVGRQSIRCIFFKYFVPFQKKNVYLQCQSVCTDTNKTAFIKLVINLLRILPIRIL